MLDRTYVENRIATLQQAYQTRQLELVQIQGAIMELQEALKQFEEVSDAVEGERCQTPLQEGQ